MFYSRLLQPQCVLSCHSQLPRGGSQSLAPEILWDQAPEFRRHGFPISTGFCRFDSIGLWLSHCKSRENWQWSGFLRGPQRTSQLDPSLFCRQTWCGSCLHPSFHRQSRSHWSPLLLEPALAAAKSSKLIRSWLSLRTHGQTWIAYHECWPPHSPHK